MVEWILHNAIRSVLILGIFTVIFFGIGYLALKWRWIPKREKGKKTEEKGTSEKSETSVTITTKEEKKVSTKKKVMAWAVVILLCLAFLPQLVGAGKWALAWIASGPDQLFRGTPRSEWGILSTPTTSAEEPEFRVVVDPSELRLDHFVSGPRDWGWQTLPTEVEGTFSIDSKERYTGLNVALLEGSKIQVHCPGYNEDNSYTAWIHAGPSSPVSIDRSGESFRVNGINNTSGALMIAMSARRPEAVSRHMTFAFKVSPRPGHTRIATWKVANGGESIQWGKLPDLGTLHWNLYVRFADEQGITLSPSVMQQYPATIDIGKLVVLKNSPKDAPPANLFPMMTKVMSESERVFGDYVVQEKNPFLAITPPDIPGKKVRIEVILDIEH